MELNIRLTPEEEKALLTQYSSIEEYAQRILVSRAKRLITDIVAKHSDDLVGVTEAEQATIDTEIGGRIIVDRSKLSDEISNIIVRRAAIKTFTEKITEMREIYIEDRVIIE